MPARPYLYISTDYLGNNRAVVRASTGVADDAGTLLLFTLDDYLLF